VATCYFYPEICLFIILSCLECPQHGFENNLRMEGDEIEKTCL